MKLTRIVLGIYIVSLLVIGIWLVHDLWFLRVEGVIRAHRFISYEDILAGIYGKQILGWSAACGVTWLVVLYLSVRAGTSLSFGGRRLGEFYRQFWGGELEVAARRRR